MEHGVCNYKYMILSVIVTLNYGSTGMVNAHIFHNYLLITGMFFPDKVQNINMISN